MSRLHVAFFVSGNGTLFETLATRCQSGDLNADPVLLISSDPQAPALQRAARLHVPALIISRADFASGEEFGDALLRELHSRDANFICLAGYMKLVPSRIVHEYKNRILNIHPALLPAFGGKGMYGRRVHEAVLDAGARITGATVHLVDEEYDRGPIVLQRPVFVHLNDDAETLERRVHTVEHDLYVEAVRLFANDRIAVNNRHVQILPGKSA
jgi:formyltetrahydrofolate-dependent phosphoribosylglycinamide formyltransferase